MSLAALAGAAFLLVLFVVRRPALGPPPGGRTRGIVLDRVRDKILPPEDQRMATVLGWPPRRLMTITGAGLAAALALMFVRQPVLAVLAGFAGVWYPRVAVRREYRRWREQVLGQLPQLADVLQALFDAGLTVPAAIREAAALVDPPMRPEVQRLAAAAVVGPEEFDLTLAEFGKRTMSPEAAAVGQRLNVAWDVRAPGEEVFSGLGRTLARLREADYMRRSKQMPVRIVGVAMLGLLNVAVAAGIPLWIRVMSQLSK